MRLSHSVILACALLAAAPAMAQDNTAAPDNAVAANAINHLRIEVSKGQRHVLQVTPSEAQQAQPQ